MPYLLERTDDPKRFLITKNGEEVGAVTKEDGGWFGHVRTPTCLLRTGPWFYPESVLAAIETGVCRRLPLTSPLAEAPSA
jgi:hypothetical protein